MKMKVRQLWKRTWHFDRPVLIRVRKIASPDIVKHGIAKFGTTLLANCPRPTNLELGPITTRLCVWEFSSIDFDIKCLNIQVSFGTSQRLNSGLRRAIAASLPSIRSGPILSRMLGIWDWWAELRQKQNLSKISRKNYWLRSGKRSLLIGRGGSRDHAHRVAHWADF